MIRNPNDRRRKTGARGYKATQNNADGKKNIPSGIIQGNTDSPRRGGFFERIKAMFSPLFSRDKQHNANDIAKHSASSDIMRPPKPYLSDFLQKIKQFIKRLYISVHDFIHHVFERNTNNKNPDTYLYNELDHGSEQKKPPRTVRSPFISHYDDSKQNDRHPEYIHADEKKGNKGLGIGSLFATKRSNTYDDSEGPHDPPPSLFRKRQKPRSFIVSVTLTIVAFLFILVFLLGVAGFGAVLGVANAYVDTTPVLDLTKIENQEQTSFIYDVNGKLITTFTGLENRIWATIDEIPPMLQNAFVAIEDERFYTHPGIDLKRIFGAFFSNLTTDTTQGGSTITQQVIKLRLLSYEQTYKRKLQEAYLALQLETQYTKDQILETYINTINLGSGNYGVKAAAKDYFGKELSELTLRESAMLASTANSAYIYSPRYQPENADKRTNLVLSRMYENGFISKDELEAAKAETVMVLEKSKKQQLYDMPYFLEYAIKDVITHFLRERNLEDTSANRSAIERELRTSGYHIYTTVDPEIQHAVEDSLYNWDSYPMMRYSQHETKTVRNPDGTMQEIIQPQAAAAVFDYRTGQLKAIVGGREAPTARKTLNRAALSNPMPVGSSIKPLAVYGPALHKGISPANTVLDIPVQIPGWRNKKGYPSNYDHKFSGPVTVREALKNSINMAAVRILIDHVSIEDSYNTLLNLGITSTINKDGAGLALGTTGISPVQMSAAYGAIANKGFYQEPVAFTRVEDARGNVILDSSKTRSSRQVFTPAASWLLVDMMTDGVRSGTGTRAKISGITVAGKTGTNSDNIGVSFSGITPHYSASVWVGHDGYEELHRGSTGGSEAAPLWKDFMSSIYEKLELPNGDIIEDSPESLGLVKKRVCSVSGKLCTEACEKDLDHLPVEDWFLAEHVPTESCDMHYEDRVCLATGKIATEYCKFGSETDPKAFILIGPDSLANELSEEDFKKYFPTGLRISSDELATFNKDNPQFAMHFCPIHTKEWYETKVQLDNLREDSNNLLTRVASLLDQYSSELTPQVIASINSAVTTLENKLNNNRPYEELKETYDTLFQLNEIHLEPLASAVGEN